MKIVMAAVGVFAGIAIIYFGLTNTRTSSPPLTLTSRVSIGRADVDADGCVSIVDIARVAQWFGQAVPPAPTLYDMDGDQHISVLDLSDVAYWFGQCYDTGRYLSPQEAVTALIESAVDLGTPGPDPVYGAGRIDICAALNRAGAITGNHYVYHCP